MKMVISGQYIKEEWKDSIRNYKYCGEDHSIFHYYVSNPLCNVLVEYFPKWVA